MPASDATHSSATAQLLEELRALIRNAQTLLGSGSAISAETAAEGLRSLEDDLVARARTLKSRGERYLREHPWQMLGAAAAVGLLLGVALARRGVDDTPPPSS